MTTTKAQVKKRNSQILAVILECLSQLMNEKWAARWCGRVASLWMPTPPLGGYEPKSFPETLRNN